jgi:hypothetical protein
MMRNTGINFAGIVAIAGLGLLGLGIAAWLLWTTNASQSPAIPAAPPTTVAMRVPADTPAAATSLPPCPVTTPNGSTPPGEQPSPDLHGNGQIWTGLWPEGKVVFKQGGPGQIYPDGSLEMKWWWWRGIDGPLTIEGRRLDASASPLRAEIPEGYGATGFQASGLIFSGEGCWEVTGRVGEARLTFVTLVVKK